MKYDPDKHHRRSLRLQGYDYTSSGAYFITICSHQRQCLFGDVVEGEMQLNALGQLVHACWQRLPFHFPNLDLDAFVIMPNHMHGILVLTNPPGRGTVLEQNIMNPPLPPRLISGSVGAIVLNFKSVTTRSRNRIQRSPGVPMWQRNYYEHVIRNEESLQAIRQYIYNNPLSWMEDQLHPEVRSKW